MGHRQFDDYDRNEWDEEHSRELRKRQRRDRRRHRNDLPEEAAGSRRSRDDRD